MSFGQEGANVSNPDNLETLNFYPPECKEDQEDDFEITKEEVENLKGALKKAEFRKLLTEYVDNVQDPESQKTYQSEVKQLEEERGNTLHFLNPIPGYVLKTSVDGKQKSFINICSNPLIRTAFLKQARVSENTKNGSLWSIPYGQSPAREDNDKAGKFCKVYDVIFHPDTLRMAEKNAQFKDKIEQTALDGVEESFKVELDRNNVKRPNLQYKGMARPTVIKYKTGAPLPHIIDPAALENELPPQCFKGVRRGFGPKSENDQATNPPLSKVEKLLKSDETKEDPHQEHTCPRYSIKYRSHVDLQDCCIDNQRGGRSTKPIPDEVILTVDLPLLRDSSTLDADVLDDGWHFELVSNQKALYELKMKLPFEVYPESAKAKFDKDSRKLHVTMRTVPSKQKQPVGKVVDHSPSEDGDNVFESVGKISNTLLDRRPTKKLVEEIDENAGGGGDADVGYESIGSNENIPTVINGNIVVKSILKGSANNRCRSKSESWIEHIDHLHKAQEDFDSLESLSESNELLTSESSGCPQEKCVRFSDQVQRQLFRSNSSILGQKKKNQKRNKNKRERQKRERHNSEGSASSFDDDREHDDEHEDEDSMQPLDLESPSAVSNPIPVPGSSRNKKNKKRKPCKAMSLE